jgi:hypothetical protein
MVGQCHTVIKCLRYARDTESLPGLPRAEIRWGIRYGARWLCFPLGGFVAARIWHTLLARFPAGSIGMARRVLPAQWIVVAG